MIKIKIRLISDLICTPTGSRSQDTHIKSVVLYQLSYERFDSDSARIRTGGQQFSLPTTAFAAIIRCLWSGPCLSHINFLT